MDEAAAEGEAQAGSPTRSENRIGSVLVVGTGLIGASVGLALRAAGFAGPIVGWDPDAAALEAAVTAGAVERPPGGDLPAIARGFDLIVLAGPVFAIADALERLAGALTAGQLVTDVGSVKQFLSERAAAAYNRPGTPGYLPGHPMAGKEVSGAANADATLFDGAIWLFTPVPGPEHPLAADWRGWTVKMGARTLDLAADRHDLLCAWVSHLPQFVATALASLLEEQFAADATLKADLHRIGGRALREMTRLGQSPYSMWRDIAHVNEAAIAASLLALEQQLAHIRENLRTAELRATFVEANEFRAALRKLD